MRSNNVQQNTNSGSSSSNQSFQTNKSTLSKSNKANTTQSTISLSDDSSTKSTQTPQQQEWLNKCKADNRDEHWIKGYRAFRTAVMKGEYETCKSIIQKNNAFTVSQWFVTPDYNDDFLLDKAAAHGHLEVFKLLNNYCKRLGPYHQIMNLQSYSPFLSAVRAYIGILNGSYPKSNADVYNTSAHRDHDYLEILEILMKTYPAYIHTRDVKGCHALTYIIFLLKECDDAETNPNFNVNNVKFNVTQIDPAKVPGIRNYVQQLLLVLFRNNINLDNKDVKDPNFIHLPISAREMAKQYGPKVLNTLEAAEKAVVKKLTPDNSDSSSVQSNSNSSSQSVSEPEKTKHKKRKSSNSIKIKLIDTGLAGATDNDDDNRFDKPTPLITPRKKGKPRPQTKLSKLSNKPLPVPPPKINLNSSSNSHTNSPRQPRKPLPSPNRSLTFLPHAQIVIKENIKESDVTKEMLLSLASKIVENFEDKNSKFSKNERLEFEGQLYDKLNKLPLQQKHVRKKGISKELAKFVTVSYGFLGSCQKMFNCCRPVSLVIDEKKFNEVALMEEKQYSLYTRNIAPLEHKSLRKYTENL